METLRDIMMNATQRLQTVGVYSPEADAAIIISAVLQTTREKLKDRLGETVTPDLRNKIEHAVTQREQRVPIARIFGRTQFRGINISTGDGVFEPCVETETLIEHLHILLEKNKTPHKGALRILDIGTGTGCLLLSALNEIPNSTGVGVDISAVAVALARQNADACGVGARAEFRVSNWIDNVPETFDIVLCNPPFVPSDLIATLVPEVKSHDPKASLDGGKDGLRFYRQLTDDFLKVSHEGTIGIFHVSMTFTEQVTRIFKNAGYGSVEVCRNYYGVPMGLIVMRDSYVESQSMLERLVGYFTNRRANS
ncbi:MAG: peptide chain release factor N(5)-glutamine methyltransferase [Alphaproteobacteria bacterium]|nr:peptide chain release factor N(5)-glutamine methyltransferase [Alphaproteobacteria bacterium]